MQSKILLTIPSRDLPRPENMTGPNCLDSAIKMFKSTCADPRNFDIMPIIDNDQISLYKEVIGRYPDLQWRYIPHRDDWLNIMQTIYPSFIGSNYSFLYQSADDIGTLTKNWDVEILNKSGAFADNMFVLYTQCNIAGRSTPSKEFCYTYHLPRKLYGFDAIIGFHEHMPILTQDWCRFLSPLFTEGKYTSGHAILVAEMIRVLYAEYNLNRHVSTNINCDNFLTATSLRTSECRLAQQFYKTKLADVADVVRKMHKFIVSSNPPEILVKERIEVRRKRWNRAQQPPTRQGATPNVRRKNIK